MDNDIIKLVFLSYIQPQAQLIKDLRHIFTVLMLTSNTVSNHRVTLTLSKRIELLEIISYVLS